MSQTWKDQLSKWWGTVKLWSYKYIGGLFLEDKEGHKVISVGRCGLIFMVFRINGFWSGWTIETGDMPPGMMEVFYAFAAYVLGSKGVGALKSKWS